MERNNGKISLSTVLLLIAIIVIIVMGTYIYKLKNTEEVENKVQYEVTNETQNVVNELKEDDKIEENVVNNVTNNTLKNEVITNSTTNTTNTKEDNNNQDSSNNKILGKWRADTVVDRNGQELGLNAVWGSGIRYSNEMEFKENGVLSYGIGITASSDDGFYSIDGNNIKYGVPTDVKGSFSESTFTYYPEEDVLKEEKPDYFSSDPNGKMVITYVRADNN